MSAPKILFVVGLVALVVGIAFSVEPTTVETWQKKEEPLLDSVITLLGGGNFFLVQNPVFIPEGSRDILISGTVRELRGARFSFYAFKSKMDHAFWLAKTPYGAYAQVEEVSSYSVSFSPTLKDLADGLPLVIMNRNPALSQSISVECSIKVSWSERSYAWATTGRPLCRSNPHVITGQDPGQLPLA